MTLSEHNDYQVAYYSERPLPRMGVDLAGTPYVRRHVDVVLDALGVADGSAVLDVGCGLGKYTKAMAERGYDVEGLDLTPRLVEALHDSAPEIPTHLGDIADLPPVLKGRFDGVTGFFVLHHVDGLADVLAGARSALRAGGRAVFLEPNPLFLGYYAQIAFTPGMTWRGERGVTRMTAKKLSEAGAKAGFGSCRTFNFGAAPPFVANRGWGRRLERMVESIPGWSKVAAFKAIVLD